MDHYWQYYVLIGTVVMILEIFVPSFFLFPIGVGIMISGVFTLWIEDRPTMHVVTALCILASLYVMRRMIKRKSSEMPPPVGDLVGRDVVLESHLQPGVKAFGKIFGESWTLVPEREDEEFDVGESAVIVGIDGNKLIIKKKTKEGEGQ